jgi:hypothetical protein
MGAAPSPGVPYFFVVGLLESSCSLKNMASTAKISITDASRSVMSEFSDIPANMLITGIRTRTAQIDLSAL